MTITLCAHHWLIETAVGPVSQGFCRLCGAGQEFTNSAALMASNWTPQAKRSAAAHQPEQAEDDG